MRVFFIVFYVFRLVSIRILHTNINTTCDGICLCVVDSVIYIVPILFCSLYFYMRMCVAAAAASAAAAATMAVVVVALNSYRAIFINPWRSKREKGLLIEYIVWKKNKKKKKRRKKGNNSNEIFCLSCVELFHIAPLCLPHKQDSSYGATPQRMEWVSEWVRHRQRPIRTEFFRIFFLLFV